MLQTSQAQQLRQRNRGSVTNAKEAPAKRIPALLLQAVTATISSEEKQWGEEELLDTIYWLRQVTGLICGVIWGLLPLKGLISFFLFVSFIMFLTVVFVNKQGVDVDEMGGAQAVYTEGLPPALGTFMLAWIFMYTAGHSNVS